MLLAVVRPDAHQCAHERRHGQVGLAQQQHPDHTAQGEGHRQQHDQRIDPALEINDQEQIDEDDRESDAGEQSVIAAAHGFHLAAPAQRIPALSGGRLASMRRSMSRAAPYRSRPWTSASTSNTGRMFNCDITSGTVPRPSMRCSSAAERCPPRYGQAGGLQISGGAEAVGGLLHHQRIAHAIARIDPEIRWPIGRWSWWSPARSRMPGAVKYPAGRPARGRHRR